MTALWAVLAILLSGLLIWAVRKGGEANLNRVEHGSTVTDIRDQVQNDVELAKRVRQP